MDDDTSRDGRTAGDHQPAHGVVAGWTVLSYLISGPLVYGGLGWGLDRWLGTEFLVPIGLVVGMALSFWIIILRYIRPVATPRAGPHGKRGP